MIAQPEHLQSETPASADSASVEPPSPPPASDRPPLPGSAGEVPPALLAAVRGYSSSSGSILSSDFSSTLPPSSSSPTPDTPFPTPASPSSPNAQSPIPSASLLHLILRSDSDLADLLDQSGISASDLIRLARTPDFKLDLADLQSLIFTTARIRAVQNLSHVATASDDLVEQRRASTAILRATSPALTSSASGGAGVSPAPDRSSSRSASSQPQSSDRASSPAAAGEDVAKRQVRASSPTSSTSSPTRHSPLTIRPPLPTHSANDLIEHLIDKLERADDYADELEEDFDEDDLDEDRDSRDYALLALHAAFTHDDDDAPASADPAPLSPALRGEGPTSLPRCAGSSGVRGYSSSSDSILSSDFSSTLSPSSSSPTPDTPFPTPASPSSPSAQCPIPSASSFDGSPVPPDPLAFLTIVDEAARDDLTNFTSHSRHIEDDEPTLYTERVILQHADGRDIYRRFTFQRPDDQSPWRLTLVEPYDPEDIDPSDGYLDQDEEDFDDEPDTPSGADSS